MDDATQKIFVENRLSRFTVRVSKIKALTATVTDALGVGDHEVAIAFVGADRMRTINRQFRGKDKATDVLSFPQQSWKQALQAANKAPRKKSKTIMKSHAAELALGDVVISLPNAKVNARNIGQSLDREVGFLIVHGLLHLCGHDHLRAAEEKIMLREQRRLMDRLAVGDRGRPIWSDCVRERRQP